MTPYIYGVWKKAKELIIVIIAKKGNNILFLFLHEYIGTEKISFFLLERIANYLESLQV